MSTRVAAPPTIAIATRPGLQHQARPTQTVVSMSMPVNTGKSSYDALKRKFFDTIKLDAAPPLTINTTSTPVMPTGIPVNGTRRHAPPPATPVHNTFTEEPRLAPSTAIPITGSGGASEGVFPMDETENPPLGGGEMVPRNPHDDDSSDSETDENDQAFVPPHILVQRGAGSTPPFSLPARRLFNNRT
ncbi:hypothetical protein Pelo_13273 [Pelomyxa schiedti]|nr:hypothetical protein Pelo_13273 [Pelomyxa schiedti]